MIIRKKKTLLQRRKINLSAIKLVEDIFVALKATKANGKVFA